MRATGACRHHRQESGTRDQGILRMWEEVSLMGSGGWGGRARVQTLRREGGMNSSRGTPLPIRPPALPPAARSEGATQVSPSWA